MSNLLEFISKYYHWFVFVLLELISLVLLFQYNSYQGSVWFSSSNVVVGKCYEWSSKVNTFFSLSHVNESLTLKNFYLERQVAQLSRLYADATDDSLAAERIKLESLSKYQLVPAKVVSNSVNSHDNLITIDKGSVDGISKDMGVVSGNGVVGIVYMVSKHYSVVMPVINSHSRVSCSIRGRGYFGYLHWTGGASNIAYVEDIPRHAHFKRGDWVETSGYSSIFPQGVIVGKILEVYNSRDGLSYRLKVLLSTDFGRLRDVCVVNDKTIVEQATLLEAARDSMRRDNK